MSRRKVVIVTVYNSENCGSFLQAYAMKVALEKCGCEAAFYKRDVKGTSHALVPHIILALKRLVRRQHGAIKFTLGPWFFFRKAVDMLPICDEHSIFYKEADAVLLGSDTIWNFEDEYFRRIAPVFLGKKFDDKYVFSYAVSAGNTGSECFCKIVQTVGGLSHIATLLVRDKHTQNLAKAAGAAKTAVVCDPTFLIEKNDYLRLIPAVNLNFRYILIYYFGEPDDLLKDSLRKYADSHGLKLVSMLKYRTWCDESIPADPKVMLQYFHEASGVVTNTFHGCAFSMIFEKPFAAHDVGKVKVRDLLVCLGEERRLFTDADGMQVALSSECEVMTSGRLERYRKESLDALQNTLQIE